MAVNDDDDRGSPSWYTRLWSQVVGSSGSSFRSADLFRRKHMRAPLFKGKLQTPLPTTTNLFNSNANSWQIPMAGERTIHEVGFELVPKKQLVGLALFKGELQAPPRIPIGIDALVLGKLIAKGSNGTFVYEGTYHGHPVAVKRHVKGFHDCAEREQMMLLAAHHAHPHHPNIIQLCGRGEDIDFIYLALQPYDCTLFDLVKKCPQLWSFPNGFPSQDLLILIRGIVDGLAHLHSVGYVLPDLDPSKVLMVGLCPKLSGVGIYIPRADEAAYSHDISESEQTPAVFNDTSEEDTAYSDDISDSEALSVSSLEEDKYYVNESVNEYQCCDELNIGEPEAMTMDMHGLGLVIYFCLTQGEHRLREPDEFPDEASDLVYRLIMISSGGRRPFTTKASKVLLHPFFWNSGKRLLFMKDVSEWLEKQNNAFFIRLLKERVFLIETEIETDWQDKLHEDFLEELERLRRKRYNIVPKKGNLVTEVLRIVGDTVNLYPRLPKDKQNVFGAMPEGVDIYFRTMFPRLLIGVYRVMYAQFKQEEWFTKYI